MDDAQIKIGMSIDTSGLAAAESTANSSADVVSSAYKRVAAAALETQNIQSRHRDILKQYQVGALDASVATQLLATNLAENAAAASATAAAMEQLNSATTRMNVAAPALRWSMKSTGDAITGVGVSARQAGAAGIGILEGRMMSGNRAATAFLATTLGLGPAIQAAFPIIGAIALLNVLVQIGKGAYEAYEKFVSLQAVWDKLADDVRKMQTQDFVNVHSIETATERLNRANESATNLRETAEALHKQSIGDFANAIVQGNPFGLASAAGGLVAAHGGAESSAERTKQSIALQLKQLELQHQLNDARIESSHAGDSALGPEKQITAEYEKRISLAKEEQKYNERRDQLMGNATPAGGGSELLKAQEAAASGTLQAERYKQNQKAIADFISESIYAYKQDEATSKEVTEAITNSWNEMYRAQIESSKQAEEADRRAVEEWKKNREEQLKMIAEQTEASIKATNQQVEEAEKIIAFRQKLQILSPKGAEQEKLAVSYTAEHQEVGALQNQQSQYNPALSQNDAAAYQKIQDQITAVQQKAAAQREQIVQQETLREVAAWQRAMQQMNSAIISATNTWMTTNKSFANSFIDSGKHLAVEYIDSLIQMTLKHIEFAATSRLVTVQTNSANVSSTATAAGATKAIETESALSSLAKSAAKAAGKAWSALSDIPIVGPELGAVAAAATYAGVMALGAFERGGIIPGGEGQAIPIIGHGREAVLPAPLTSMLMNAANNGSNSGGGHSFTSVSNINATVLDPRGLDAFVDRTSDSHGRAMSKFARRLNATN